MINYPGGQAQSQSLLGMETTESISNNQHRRVMARPLDRIEQEILEQEQAARDLAAEFEQTYFNYLSALGQAVRQQLILAAYHICTQGYPQEFLELSVTEKQQLQERLREIGDRAKQDLVELLEDSDSEPDSPQATLAAEVQEAIEIAIAPVEETPSDIKEIADPDSLAHWQEDIESGIGDILQKLSRDANRLLHQSEIGSQNVPEMFLEAAMKVPNETMPGLPNLIDLTLETEGPEELQNLPGMATLGKGPLHIMAIHLKLSDIEFADPRVSAYRGPIRNLSGRLNALKRDYQRVQKERAIARAESAWRATWFED